MNDKFKMLALQATIGKAEFDNGSYYVATPDKMQKFAELIVAECLKLNSKELSITAIERLLPLYQEHFGVEE